MIVKLRVSTNSPEQSVENHGGFLKVRVKAKPMGGKANLEIVELLADHFKVEKENVRIVRGLASNRKVVEIQQAKKITRLNSLGFMQTRKSLQDAANPEKRVCIMLNSKTQLLVVLFLRLAITC